MSEDVNRAKRLEAAADSLAELAVGYICEDQIWPLFAAWSNQQPGTAWIPESSDGLRAVRAILTQRTVATIVAAFGVSNE